MRENRCDSTLPRSTRCSLILQIETHATTTNIMRHVEYITNGFGAPTQGMGGWGDILRGQFGGLFQPTTPKFTIRQTLLLQAAPETVIDAALATFLKFGSAGFQRTADFMRAVQKSDDSLVMLFPNLFSQPISGAKFKSLFNGMLNTAASRTGLTPLSSIFIQAYRDILQEIPDREPNALRFWQQTKRTIPSWLTDPTFVQSLVGKV